MSTLNYVDMVKTETLLCGFESKTGVSMQFNGRGFGFVSSYFDKTRQYACFVGKGNTYALDIYLP